MRLYCSVLTVDEVVAVLQKAWPEGPVTDLRNVVVAFDARGDKQIRYKALVDALSTPPEVRHTFISGWHC